MKRLWCAGVGGLLLLGMSLQTGAGEAQAVLLGTPQYARYDQPAWWYARNIWDMRWFDGRLYLGMGNSSNQGLAVNAGPVPIMVFDPKTGRFEIQGQVDDEQIDRLVVLDGQLVIPGHDARESWQWGNVYVRDAGSGHWVKRRTLPQAVHVYDVTSLAGVWYAAVGTARGGGVLRSADQGQSWQPVAAVSRRVYGFLPLGQARVAVPAWSPHARVAPKLVVCDEHDCHDQLPDTPAALFAGLPLAEGQWLKVDRAVAVGEGALYVAGHQHNDHQINPLGLYYARFQAGRLQVSPLPLPEGFQPWDLLVSGQEVDVLVCRPEADGSWSVRILTASVDAPQALTLRVSVRLPALARAFERGQGGFYVAMGSEPGSAGQSSDAPVSAHTGSLWWVPVAGLQP